MAEKPWYLRAHRWNQVNSVETDPRDCDLEVWRKYWRDNHIQGTIVNAAGTVGYYPSDNPYQYRAKFLDGRDYYNDFATAAREEGLVVIARMDSNQATEDLYKLHPDWFCKDKNGNPVRHTPGRYYTCVNGGYYAEQLAGVIQEIIEKYKPDALADNSWAGGRGFICYCDNCKKKFKKDTGLDLPAEMDFADRTFRIWLDWSQKIRVDLYGWFNELSMRHGGEDCIYLGMLHPDAYSKDATSLVMDYASYGKYNKAVMIDGQIRQDAMGFDANALLSLSMHEIYGDEALALVSVATYHFSPNFMRKAANANEETSYWMRTSMLGGVSPSPHFIGGVQEDTRTLENGTAMMAWHRKNEEFLYDRSLVSGVGLVRSLRNTCYYGQKNCETKTIAPMNGMISALKRGRISYFPIDSRQIGDKLYKSKLLIMPDIAVLTDDELKNIETFVRGGGSLVFSGATGMLDEWGYARKNFPLDELLGIERQEKEPIAGVKVNGGVVHDPAYHNYIRIDEPRHEIFAGFEKTTILGLHGTFYKVKSSKLTGVAHMVPAFPTYPPEVSFMDDDKRVSEHPAILVGETGFGGRVVYFAADYDRKNGETFFPDYGNLIKNAIIWALGKENRDFTVEGPGELECKVFSQKEGQRLILHIVNHSGLGKWPGSVEEIYPVGPEKVCIKVGKLAVKSVRVQSLDKSIDFKQQDGCVTFTLDQVQDQDIIVIE